MKKRLKKTIALIIGVVLVMTSIQMPVDVRAAGTQTVGSGQTVTISDTTETPTFDVSGTLVIADGGTVTGEINISGPGRVEIQSGGTVSGTITVGMGGKLVNAGTAGGVNVQASGAVENNAGGTIDSLDLAGAVITNNGIVKRLTVKDSVSRSSIIMNETSKIEQFTLNQGSAYISSLEGATIGTAKIGTTIGFESDSTGTVTITDMLSLSASGNGGFPENLKVNVNSSTWIYNDAAVSGWSVYCDGKKYIIPASSYYGSFSDMYKATFFESSVALPDLTVQYDATDVTEKTFTISNNGTYKIRWEISEIPEFVELYDATTELSKDDTITLAAGESKKITVKAKSDLAADEYTGSISFNVYTAEGATTADDTLMTTKDIPVTLNVNRKTGSGTIKVNDVYYGTPVTYTASSNTNDGDPTVEFKKRDAANNTYSPDVPNEVGEYTARATFAQTDIYKKYEVTANFAILRKKGSGTVTVDDIYYGEQIIPVATSVTNGNDNVTYEYKEKDAGYEAYTATEPTLAGEYTVRATFAQTDEYNVVTVTDDFTIFRKTGSGTITVADIHYGETLNPVVASDANGTGSVIIEYKKKGAPDDSYSTTKPEKVGEYTARATFAQTDEYNVVTATDDFDILRIEGAGTVTVADIHYGETISPVVTSATNGTDNVSYEYKVKGEADTTYTQTTPMKVGEYTVRATFAQTDIYNEVTATDDFEILRNEGTGTVTVETVYYGGTISPVVTSTTNGTDNVSYEYKVKGAADTTYTQTPPTQVGAYTVRTTFAQTDIYNAVTATDDFEITYLKAPEAPYSMSGKQGNNGYYTSKVIITPAEGYLIAESLDGDYRENLTVKESNDKFNIYLKKIATGEKTAAIQVTEIKIDMDAPVILNAGSGEKIYGEQVEIVIKDDNLARVLVNEEEVKIENNMAILQLSSNHGEETYEITCIDVAGNTSKTKVVVAAEWMKKKIIPEGSKIRLSKEYSYQLGGGTWHVEGDDTSYAGDITFYVSSDGEYIFTKIGE